MQLVFCAGAKGSQAVAFRFERAASHADSIHRVQRLPNGFAGHSAVKKLAIE